MPKTLPGVQHASAHSPCPPASVAHATSQRGTKSAALTRPLSCCDAEVVDDVQNGLRMLNAVAVQTSVGGSGQPFKLFFYTCACVPSDVECALLASQLRLPISLPSPHTLTHAQPVLHDRRRP